MDTQPAPKPKDSSDKAVGIGMVCGALVFPLLVQPIIAAAEPGFQPRLYLVGPGGIVGGVIEWLIWRLEK